MNGNCKEELSNTVCDSMKIREIYENTSQSMSSSDVHCQ